MRTYGCTFEHSKDVSSGNIARLNEIELKKYAE